MRACMRLLSPFCRFIVRCSVHTLSLRTASQLADVFRSGDIDALTCTLPKVRCFWEAGRCVCVCVCTCVCVFVCVCV